MGCTSYSGALFFDPLAAAPLPAAPMKPAPMKSAPMPGAPLPAAPLPAAPLTQGLRTQGRQGSQTLQGLPGQQAPGSASGPESAAEGYAPEERLGRKQTVAEEKALRAASLKKVSRELERMLRERTR
ncbi:hypothetical protein FBY31_3155 [Arthrobacter sp. SLBN-100]|nr:hypothetical protein FBY31_3155 [Arthrobacter sp. SLBN-100]